MAPSADIQMSRNGRTCRYEVAGQSCRVEGSDPARSGGREDVARVCGDLRDGVHRSNAGG